LLRCEDDSHEFPVIGGVPRMILPGERRGLGERYPAFFARHRTALGAAIREECGARVGQDEVQAKIIDRFGYEWTRFAEYDSDNFLYWIQPLTAEFFAGRLGLDVGCGGGRHAAKAVSFGAEMVALDLSWAVEVAERRAVSDPRLHVVQGNAFALPFARESFDFIYSLGVLHHTPDPPRAFRSIVPYAKKGGAVFVMIYGSQRRQVIRLLALLRKVTTRLPNVAIEALSYAGGVIDMGFILPYRGLRAIGLGGLARRVFPTRIMNYSRSTFRDVVTDWFDRLSYPEVHYYSDAEIHDWYARSGCMGIRTSPILNHAYRGLGYAPGATTGCKLLPT
jgi:SAM-dependent methyltransferase